jgi:protein MpaA
VHKGMPVVTIELPSAFRTPLDAEMRQMWLDLLRWMSERVVPEQPDPRVVPVKAKKTG